jgi:WhiB family redox-sensing transcriptional regulator
VDTILDAPASSDRGWTERAACADLETNRFFPSESDSSAAAVVVCKQCPVQSDCLQDALRHRIVDGVWGGWTERERMGVLRMRPRQWAA